LSGTIGIGGDLLRQGEDDVEIAARQNVGLPGGKSQSWLGCHRISVIAARQRKDRTHGRAFETSDSKPNGA